MYFALSFTHKNTAMHIRERLSLDDFKTQELYRLICAHESIHECVILSTCNRLELLCVIEPLPKAVEEYLNKCLALVCSIDELLIKDLADVYEDAGFAHHLFSVAASLDSLVIGEMQISSQLKKAFAASYERGFCAEELALLMDFANKCAAKVRTSTAISKNPVSVSSIAVSKARELVDLKGKDILILGSGQMSELAIRHLAGLGANLTMASRSIDNARKLANCLAELSEIRVLDFANLKELLNTHSIIFSATSASNAVIDESLLLGCKKMKRYFFDIALPRDIALENDDLNQVFCIDDLNEIAQKNLALREEEAQRAYKIVRFCVQDFYTHLRLLKSRPAIRAMRQRAQKALEIELEKAKRKKYIKNSDEEEVKRFGVQLLQGFLHEPTMRIKNHEEGGYELIEDIFE